MKNRHHRSNGGHILDRSHLDQDTGNLSRGWSVPRENDGYGLTLRYKPVMVWEGTGMSYCPLGSYEHLGST